MQTTLLLLIKVALLVLLWFFIWMTIRALRKDTDQASGLSHGGVVAMNNAAPGYAHGGAPHAHGGAAPAGGHALKNSFRRNKNPRYLLITNGPLAGTTLEFAGYEEITIGRSQSCTLVLEDDFASGTHARLIHRGSDWYIEDQDSRNGTWIGNQRLDQPERLAADMEIRIGQTHVRMQR